jgi:hypothetical protein
MGLKAAGQPNRRGFQKPCEMPMKTPAHTRSPDRAISSALLERLRAARCAFGYMGAIPMHPDSLSRRGLPSFLILTESVTPHANTRQNTGGTKWSAKSNLRHRISPTRTLAHVRSFEHRARLPMSGGIERSSRNPTHRSRESTRQHTVFQKMGSESATDVEDFVRL